MVLRMKWLVVIAFMLCGFASAASAQWKPAPLERPATINPKLYREGANAPKEIQEARAAALKQNKRVLLVFGANWCIDCHILDRAFHQPRVAPLLQGNYVVVHIDVGQYDKNLALAKQYHVDLGKGVPSVAVIDAKNTLVTSSTEFEKAHLLTEQDVIDFLDQWKPKRS
jgi:thiol:disulfide interchange protein